MTGGEGTRRFRAEIGNNVASGGKSNGPTDRFLCLYDSYGHVRDSLAVSLRSDTSKCSIGGQNHSKSSKSGRSAKTKGNSRLKKN